MIVSSKLIYLILMPIGISFVLSLILRFIKSNVVLRLGYISPIIAIIISYFFYFSLPEWPLNDKQILSYIIILSAISSIILDLITEQNSLLRRVLIVAGPLLALVWISSVINTELKTTIQILTFVVTFIIFIVIGFNLADKDSDDNQIGTILAMFVIGVGIIGNVNGNSDILSISMIIFSALIGIQLTNWPKKFLTNSILLLGIGTPILSILAIVSFDQKINKFSIITLLLILFLEKIIRLPLGQNKILPVIRTFIICLSSILIIFAAISIQRNEILEYIKI